jgi:hypothetical protein
LNPAASPWRGSRVEAEKGRTAPQLSRYFIALAMIWVIAMTWRIYPQFGDALRIEGRVMTLSDYVGESCAQRIGPAATSCDEEALETGRRLVARQQGKSVLLVEAPLLGYLLVYLPLRMGIDRLRGRRLRRTDKGS